MFEGRSYEDYTRAAPTLFKQLVESDLRPFKISTYDRKIPGIYILYENGSPVYVGRTRNLQGRLRAHVTKSHNSASFALKRTRSLHPEIRNASYSGTNSRKEIVKHPVYGRTFELQIAAIKAMQFRFIEVADPIEQYFLELFATMELRLDISGFDTH
ncbi:GIY-YIG nuclease family protein [Sulfitobacter albidus]|uniref:GIY-YIG nuclease family protein n=1 Tax=Sulfitobacter albidus TaxID=2829501 RepID=A0A975JEM1_9RHOB|nr:GIY-YIG nuclease family protein [Sulfitobacter albidus]QUJ77084.1 GIY-YIG nuclease family protein [Sulfitobacter albidus]